MPRARSSLPPSPQRPRFPRGGDSRGPVSQQGPVPQQGPIPQQGPSFRWALHCRGAISVLLLGLLAAGCGWHGKGHPLGHGTAAQEPPPLENPMFVPVSDREFAWNQLVDTVDTYVQIEREARVRQIGGVLTEGRIDTFPLTGATLFEPWRRDSTRGFQRWQDTFQSTRRRAVLRVTPVPGGYLIDVAVHKELEDLSQPERAKVGENTLRHDGTLVRQPATRDLTPVTLGWIPIGRDMALEQRLLTEIQGRLANYASAGAASTPR